MQSKKTSWQNSSKWYSQSMGVKGDFFHQEVILPNILRIMNLKTGQSILDLACGEGVLSRAMPEGVKYWGLEVSSKLIEEARAKKKVAEQQFLVADVTKELPINKRDFDWVTIILAIQNIKRPFLVIKNAAQRLKPGGRLIMVLNHPCFRIPKQSAWEIDETKKIQYRRINKYMSPLEIEIETNPSQGERSIKTWSFHYPISAYTEMLFNNGMGIEKIEEWVSSKKSTGRVALMEDQARREFPLFMTIVAKRLG